MNEDILHDAGKVARELRDQLASEKRRIAFFLGAGTSIAIGVPGIVELTSQVEDKLDDSMKPLYELIRTELANNYNIEQVLERARLLKELPGEGDDKKLCLTSQTKCNTFLRCCSARLPAF